MQEVGVNTRNDGHSRSTDTEETATVMVGSGAMVEVRDMGPAAMMDITEVTGVNTGAKLIHPTLPNLRIYIDSSAVIIPTAMKVGKDN